MPYGGTDLQITARQKSFLITLREEEGSEGLIVEELFRYSDTAGEKGHIAAVRMNHKAILCSQTQINHLIFEDVLVK